MSVVSSALLLEPAEESCYLKASNPSAVPVQVCIRQMQAWWQQALFSQNPHQQPKILKESDSAG